MNNHTDKKANTIKLYFLAYKNNLEANYVTSPVNFSTNLTEKEEAVLNEVKSKCTATSSELEKSPPKSLSARDVRVAIQSLVTKGRIEVNDCLKFVPTRERQSESCPE